MTLAAATLTPASAATSFARTRLDSSFQTDTLKTRCNAIVSASEQVTASRYTVEVRDSSGRSVGQCGVISNVAITPTGTKIVGTLLLATGSYSYAPFVTVGGAQPVQVGAFEPLSVVNGPVSTPSPSPSPTPTPTQTPSPTAPPMPSPTTSPSPSVTPPASGDVLFSDDFTGAAGSTYDHSKWGEWSTATYNSSAGYGNIKPGDRATLDGQGHLSIPATPTQGTSISTKDHFAFTTGTMEARVYMQGNKTGPGYWPAVWALNNNPSGKDAAHIGEADLLEAYTGLAEYAHVATHHYDTTNGANNWSGSEDPACGRGAIFDQWVTVKMVVENDKITFFYNGVQCGAPHLRSEQPGKPYAFAPDVQQGLWPILTLAVGGAGGQQDGKAVKPGVFLVDYVKVTR